MSFRKPCHMPFRKLIPPFTLTAYMGQARALCYKLPFAQSTFRIIHRFWATCRKLLDKNRLDFKASRLRIRQSNRKREIETRSHLSR